MYDVWIVDIAKEFMHISMYMCIYTQLIPRLWYPVFCYVSHMTYD